MWWASGFWWIFPVIGIVICMTFMAMMAFLFRSMGGGCMRSRERH